MVRRSRWASSILVSPAIPYRNRQHETEFPGRIFLGLRRVTVSTRCLELLHSFKCCALDSQVVFSGVNRFELRLPPFAAVGPVRFQARRLTVSVHQVNGCRLT